MTPAEIIALLTSLANAQTALGTLFQNARAQGRDVSEEELNNIAHDDDVAKALLDTAIAKARAAK
jgi:hypothetical protein